MWSAAGCTGLTGIRERVRASRKEHNEEAALAQRPRPITQPLPFIHFLFFFILRSAFPTCFVLSSYSPPLVSHFLDHRSKYPSAVNSNRSFNDTSRHWQVLSARATMVRDVRRDKIGATNSDIENTHNGEEAGRRAGGVPRFSTAT